MTISEVHTLGFLIRVPWHEGAGKSSASIDQTTSESFHIETSDRCASKWYIF